ncbi:MAG: hypothetical protein WAR79_13255 [Melioribacteraceae bacterium]
MITPDIWSNRKFLRLTDKEKLLYIGLFSTADDYGKLWFDLLSIKASVFPCDNITETELFNSLKKLHDLKLIIADEIVIKIHGWKNHQSVPKPTNSTIPEPKLKHPSLPVREQSHNTGTLPEHNSLPADKHSLPADRHGSTTTVTAQSKESNVTVPRQYQDSNATGTLPEQYGSDTVTVNLGESNATVTVNHGGSNATGTLPPKERKKEKKKESTEPLTSESFVGLSEVDFSESDVGFSDVDIGFSELDVGLSEKDKSLLSVKHKLMENVALFSHSEYNEILELIVQQKHLQALGKIYEKIENINTTAN